MGEKKLIIYRAVFTEYNIWETRTRAPGLMAQILWHVKLWSSIIFPDVSKYFTPSFSRIKHLKTFAVAFNVSSKINRLRCQAGHPPQLATICLHGTHRGSFTCEWQAAEYSGLGGLPWSTGNFSDSCVTRAVYTTGKTFFLIYLQSVCPSFRLLYTWNSSRTAERDSIKFYIREIH